MAYEGLSVRIPLGGRGLTGRLNPLTIDAESLIQAEGITFDGEFLAKEPGTAVYTTTPLGSAIMSLYDWYGTAAQQYLIAVTADGRILRDDGSRTFAVTLKSGLGGGRVTHLCEGGKESAALPKKLFAFNGFDPVQVISGTTPTATPITTPAADWTGNDQPTFGIHHNGRIWAGGNPNDPHRLYFCDATNHEVYTGTSAGSLSVYPGVGQGLVGGISFGGRLLVFKRPRGVFWIDDSQLTKTDWRVLQLSNGVGLASPWGIIATEGTVLFVAPEGLIYDMSLVEAAGGGTDTPGGMFPSSLTTTDDLDVWIRGKIDPGNTANAQILYHSALRTVYTAMRRFGAASNDVLVSMDAKRDPLRFAYSYNHNPTAITMHRQSDGVQRLISGDEAGNIWTHDIKYRNIGGKAYSGRFQLAHTNFSQIDTKLADVRKRAKFLVVYFNPTGAHSLAMDILLDGIYSQSVQFPQGAVGGMLDSFILGQDRLGGSLNTSRRRRIKGSAFQYSVIGYNNGLNEDFHINELVWQFVPAARRERR